MVLKKKPSVHGVCIGPKKKVTPKKPPTKSDLTQEIKILKNLNFALEKEDKTQAETIAALQEKLANPSKKVLSISISTETDSSSIYTIYVFILPHVKRSLVGIWEKNMIFNQIHVLALIFHVTFVENGVDLLQI